MIVRSGSRGWPRALITGVTFGGALLAAGCTGDDVAASSTTSAATTASTAATATATATASTGVTSPAPSAPPSAPSSAHASTTAPPVPANTAGDPGDQWTHVDPVAAGFDPAALEQLALTADAADTACTVVVRDGAVVDERYWDGTTADTIHPAWSITKSVTSVLTGIAQDHGELSIEDTAATYIPSWRDTPSDAVTVEHLLSNDSGRHWDVGTDYAQMAIAAPDKTRFAIGLAQDHAPGTVWAYNNAAVQTLSAVLGAATGEPVSDYADEVLFGPVGMSHSTMTTDQAGNTMTFAGLQTTCLDLARLGHLMLRDGVWNGEQIVSAEYVRQATRRSSTDLNAAYGWLWWTNQPGPIVLPTIATSAAESPPVEHGQLLPGAPTDVFWALGFQQQILAVIPSEGIVAVRMGANPPDGVRLSPADFTQGVLDALAEERAGS